LAQAGTVEEILRRYTGRREVSGSSSLDALGLSSLDRIQLLMELEQRAGVSLDEEQFANAKTVADLTRMQPATAATVEDFEFPEWSRSRPARFVRRLLLPGLVLPLARVFAWIRVEGLENLRDLQGPVIFASNHQSHFDVPSIFWSLPARWRYNVAPAMSKEFFDAWFHPERHTRGERFRRGLMYYLSVLAFNTFPLPQREAGARGALRYAGDLVSNGYSIIIFPEGKRTGKGEIYPFQPGVGMLASRLGIPVVPVRLEGFERVLHQSARMATPGRARVKFGRAMKVEGDNYGAGAKEIEAAVRAL
jgi:long-chain acyl-CoA synthetase